MNVNDETERGEGSKKSKRRNLREYSIYVNLLDFSIIKRLMKHRAFQFALILPNFVFFSLIIVAGLFGVQAAKYNFATIATWNIWWILIVFTFLFFARAWCLICPLIAPGEWLQRLTLWRVKKPVGLNRKWPSKLRNFWISNSFFVILTWLDYYVGVVSSPLYTVMIAIMLFIVPGIVVSLIFERRAFCKYVCPVGSVIGAYSMSAPIELRVRDTNVCRKHMTSLGGTKRFKRLGKRFRNTLGDLGHTNYPVEHLSCISGNEDGYGCPMGEFPMTMDENTYCTLCTECIKTCPHDNIALNIRLFFVDLWRKKKGLYKRLDVAVIILFLLGIIPYHSFVMTFVYDDLSRAIESVLSITSKQVLSLTYWPLGVALPVIVFYTWSWLTKILAGDKETKTKNVLINYAFAFIPIGIFSHLAHNIYHLLLEGSLIVPLISDPFGWGWNLFGTAKYVPRALAPLEIVILSQIALVIFGFFTSVYVGHKISLKIYTERKRATRGLISMMVLMMGYAVLNLWIISLPMMMRF